MKLRNYSHSFLLFAFLDGLSSMFISKNNWKDGGYEGTHNQYRQTAYNLRRKGYVKISTNAAGQRFLKLTEKGELELLMAKAWLNKIQKWDGKWRMVIFDIPEDASEKRDKLRRLLKTAGFVKLQASVYIHPHPLNREAVEFLKKTGLISYIRIGRIDELDDDRNLIKHFNLTKPV